MPIERCSTCKYWITVPDDLDYPVIGRCQRFRFPDRVIKKANDWCGEWKPDRFRAVREI